MKLDRELLNYFLSYSDLGVELVTDCVRSWSIGHSLDRCWSWSWSWSIGHLLNWSRKVVVVVVLREVVVGECWVAGLVVGGEVVAQVREVRVSRELGPA